jgi:hypothetical protein
MKTSLVKYPIILIFIASELLLSINVKAQDESEVTWRDRLFFGGNLSLAVGTVTLIEISPLVGYRLTPRWSAGFGIKYEYYKSSSQDLGYIRINGYSTSIYGTNVFTNYVFFKNFLSEGLSLMAQAEYEALSLEKKYFQDYSSSGRFVLHSVFMGGGIRQRIGRRSSINILLLYNLTETQNSPYPSNPILKFNFIF